MIAPEPSILTVQKVFIDTRAAHTVNSAARSCAFAAKATATAIYHTLHDFNQMLALGLGAYREYGNPIDPTEAGQLGSLWLDTGPRQYVVDQNHPLYDEILQFFIATTSMTLAISQQALEHGIQHVTEEARKMAEAFNGGIPYMSASVVDVPALDRDIPFVDLACPEACVLQYVRPVVEYIKGQGGAPPCASIYNRVRISAARTV